MRSPLAPGSTIGILGGGQLGRMLSLAAARLGLKTHIYSDRTDDPGFDVAAARTTAPYSDTDALAAFAQSVDIVTCEFENVPAGTLAALSGTVAVCPPPQAFAVAQDRLHEKDFLKERGIAVASYAAVDGSEDLEAAFAAVKLPALLKTRRLGYDGKGQVRIRNRAEAEDAFAELGAVPAILEGFVAFDREVSVIAARGSDGAMVFYDPAENVHDRGILATSRVPSALSAEHASQAKEITRTVAEALSYVGVLCVELFHRATETPALLVNEIAPRVHNSGHWTIDACAVDQFENHIRAIANWPLGNPGRHSDAVMVNLVGEEIDRWEKLAGQPDLALHIYGKNGTSPGRKMGHYTRLFPKV
jgi:5-(carboxyamino)imidazole ribonucleotide synthase